MDTACSVLSHLMVKLKMSNIVKIMLCIIYIYVCQKKYKTSKDEKSHCIRVS